MFDPYHKWLGIRPDQRPPTLYQLLGISPEEQDPEVLEEAALRQIAHVRTYQIGPHAKECQQVLNEIAQARTILLDPARRKDYDARLAKKLSGQAPPDPAEVFAFADAPRAARPAPAPPTERKPPRPPSAKPTEEAAPARTNWLLIGGGVGVVALAGIVTGAVFLFRGEPSPKPNPQPAPFAKGTVPTPPVPQPQPEPPPPTPMPDPDPVPPPKPKPIPPPPEPIVKSGGELRQFRLGPAPVGTLAYTPDGRQLLAYSHDRTLRLVDAASGAEVRRFQGPVEPIHRLAFSPDGRYALAACGSISFPEGMPTPRNCVAQLWDMATGQLVRQYEGHTAPVLSVAFSPDGKRAVTGSGARGNDGTGKTIMVDCTVRLWEVDTGRELSRIGLPYRAFQLDFAADGNRVIAANVLSQQVRVWDLTTTAVRSLGLSDSARRMVVGMAGRRLLGEHVDRTLKLWDVDTARVLATFPYPGADATALAIAPNGAVALVATAVFDQSGLNALKDACVRVLDLGAGKELTRLGGHGVPVTALAIAPDSNRAVTVSRDGILRVWALPEGTRAVVVQPPPKPAVSEVRAPAPDEAKQAEAERLIKELFKADYAAALKAKAAAARVALANKLFQKAGETKDDPAARYVLLREARDLASQAGDTALTLGAIEEMARWYTVEALDLKVAALTVVAKVVTGPTAGKALVDGLLVLVEEALGADNFDLAGRLLTQAEAAARRTQNLPQVAPIQARGKEIAVLQKEHEAAQVALAVLAKNPADAEANQTAGQYLCYRKGNWDKGLTHLAGGTDAAVAGLAKRDLARPQGAPAQVELADAWYDLADKIKGPHEVPLKTRSEHWYRQALPSLTGLTQTRIEKRLQALAELPATLRVSAPGGELRRLTGHTERITGVSFGRDGSRVLTASADGTLRLWDADSGKELRKFTGQRGDLVGLALTRDGSRVVSANVDGQVQVHEVDTGRLVKSHGFGGGLESISLSPDGNVMVGGSRSGTLWVWPLNGTGASGSGGSGGAVQCVAFAPSGKMFLYIRGDGLVHLRDPDGRRDMGKPFGVQGAEVKCAAFSPDSGFAVTGGTDRLLRLWNLQTGQETRTFKGHAQRVTSVAFSADGRRLLSGSDDRTVRLWDVKTGRELQRFTLHSDKVNSVALSADGRRAVSGGDDKTVRIWSLPR